ncbi:MAG: tetratricopeptide repeat protein [Silicimonas sp.]|nr:tetratricopeptide repeat protein [Silicimonas sp.]
MALAACDSAGGLGTSDGGGFAPAGRPLFEQSVDGLTVGHRLMAAGEYELALKAYLRAASEQGVNVDVLSAIGSANLALGRLGQAEEILRRATEADETFPPAWNNLGVVLMEKGHYGEASRVFKLAFALDSGQSAEIRDNLTKALAKLENPEYSEDETFRLVRRGRGFYQLLETPKDP